MNNCHLSIPFLSYTIILICFHSIWIPPFFSSSTPGNGGYSCERNLVVIPFQFGFMSHSI
jgi:hypothetical protein